MNGQAILRLKRRTADRAALLVTLASIILTACGGGGGSEGGDNPGQPPASNLPALSIQSADLTENDTGTQDLVFDITMSATASSDVTVEFATSDVSATAGDDYTQSSGVATISAGNTITSVRVPIVGEQCFEEDEDFSVTLSNVSSNARIAAAVATGTIANDDDQPIISIADSETPEGDSGTSMMPFTVSVDRSSCVDVQANFSGNIVTTNDQDFDVVTTSFVLPAGALETVVNITVIGDTIYETDETLSVNLEDLPSIVAPGDIEAFGTIRTDDLPPVFVSDTEISEGDAGSLILTFQVALAGITNEVSIDYETSDQSATVSDNDYTATSGTLTIPAGEVLGAIEVEIIGDTMPESHETFRLTMSNLVGDAVLQAGLEYGTGTILDDDTPITVNPTVVVAPANASEGDSGLTPMVFDVSVNAVVSNDIVIDYSTSDVTARVGEDYNENSGRLRISAGETSGSITVDIRGDDVEEQAEYFNLNLTLVAGDVELFSPRATGTILDDDYVGPSRLVLRPASVFEGDSGIRDLVIAVTMHPASQELVTVDFATRDFTALSGSDYEATSGTLTFPIGETVGLIQVPVFGDTLIEAHEELDIELSNATGNAIIIELPSHVLAGRIDSDDPFAKVTIEDVTEFEGNSGQTAFEFTVSIDAVAADPVTLDFESGDPVSGNAASPVDDYLSVGGSLSIAAGELETRFTVQAIGDTDNEYDEHFEIQLSNVSQNAEFDDAIARGRIANDDGSPGWGNPEVLDQLGTDNILPRVAMNDNGDGMVVWASTQFLQSFESSRFDAAGGWSASETLPNDFSSQHFDLFINSVGDTDLVWTISRALSARHTTAGGWTTGVEFEPASLGGQEFVDVTGNGSDELLAVWQKSFTATPNVRDLAFSTFDPATGQWGVAGGAAVDTVASGEFIFNPSVAINSSGNGVAVWDDFAPYASTFDATTGTWTVPEVISSELIPGFDAPGIDTQVAVDDAGNAIAIWDDNGSVGLSSIGSLWASHYDVSVSVWSQPIQLETVNVDATHGQIAMDAAGNAFVVWLQDNDITDSFNDSFEIWARRYDRASQSWEPEILIQDSDTRVSQFGFFNLPDFLSLDTPKLAVDAAGNAIVVWSEEINGEFLIRASRYDITEVTPTWSPPENISGAAYPFAIFPEIAINESGNAIVAWQAGNTERFDVGDIAEVWRNQYTAP